jgi:hypothetical protein
MKDINVIDYREMNFFMIMNNIHKHNLSPYALAVYTVFARYANNNTKQSFPQIPTIMKMTKMGRNSVVNATKELIKAELIRKIRGGTSRSNRYYLINPSNENMRSLPDKLEKFTRQTPEVCETNPINTNIKKTNKKNTNTNNPFNKNFFEVGYQHKIDKTILNYLYEHYKQIDKNTSRGKIATNIKRVKQIQDLATGFATPAIWCIKNMIEDGDIKDGWFPFEDKIEAIYEKNWDRLFKEMVYHFRATKGKKGKYYNILEGKWIEFDVTADIDSINPKFSFKDEWLMLSDKSIKGDK